MPDRNTLALCLMAVAATCNAGYAAPDEADDVAAATEAWFRALDRGDWPAVVQSMHPEALARARRLYGQFESADLPAPQYADIFGDTPRETLSALDDAAYFERILRRADDKVPRFRTMLGGRPSVEVLGKVDDRDGGLFVLYRSRDRPMEPLPPAFRRLPMASQLNLRRFGTRWLVYTAGNVEVLPLVVLQPRTGQPMPTSALAALAGLPTAVAASPLPMPAMPRAAGVPPPTASSVPFSPRDMTIRSMTIPDRSGCRWEWSFGAERVGATPSWDFDPNSQPPLPLAAAYDRARAWLVDTLGSGTDWRLKSVTLDAVADQRWAYTLDFTGAASYGPAGDPRERVIVLMDGSVIEPTRREPCPPPQPAVPPPAMSSAPIPAPGTR